MNKERLAVYANLTLTAFGVGIALLIFFKYLFLALMPFILSWITAFLLRPAVRRISEKTRIPRRLVSVVLKMLTVIIGIGVISLFIFLLVKEAWEFFSALASDSRVLDSLSRITNPIGIIFGDSEISSDVGEEIKNALSEGLSRLVSMLVDFLSVIVSSVPKVFFFILVSVIGALYFALDLEKINAFVKQILPKRAVKALVSFKNATISVSRKYLSSYLVLMLITFIFMLLGFIILRVKNALFLAVILAILDLLPLIGIGTVLVPWSIALFFLGNAGLAIGLIVLLVLHEITRQLIEPKIIGKSIGVHPIVSLALLYIGYSALGIIGILLVPVIAVVLNVFFDKKNSSEIG